MVDKIFIDTNIIIHDLRLWSKKKGKLNFSILSELGLLPVISTVTVSELWAGQRMEAESEEEFVSDLISACEIVDVNFHISKIAGEIVRKSKYQVEMLDAVIAASSINQKIPLWTDNVKHFKNIENLQLISRSDLLD